MKTTAINNRRYLGNKYRLLPFITRVVKQHCDCIKTFADLFSGIGSIGVSKRKSVRRIDDYRRSNSGKKLSKPFR